MYKQGAQALGKPFLLLYLNKRCGRYVTCICNPSMNIAPLADMLKGIP